jgi:DHA2 family multidrug resistance protein
MNVMRNLGGTLGIALAQTMIAQRAQVHQARYVETLNPLNPGSVRGTEQLSQALQGAGHADAGGGAQQALALLYRTLGQQASFLAYIDVFHTFMLVTLGCLPLLLLLRPPRAGQRSGAGGAA